MVSRAARRGTSVVIRRVMRRVGGRRLTSWDALEVGALSNLFVSSSAVRCDALVAVERVARRVVAGSSTFGDFLRFCE